MIIFYRYQALQSANV